MQKATVQQIRMSLAEAISGIGGEYNINIKVGSITYSDTGFTAKVIGEETDNNGVSKQTVRDWQMAVKLELVQNDWFGRVFYRSGLRNGGVGKRVNVVGYDFNKRKYPLILQIVGGGVKYKMSVLDFKNLYSEEK